MPQTNYQEPFRPQFHYTPEKNWMNDPNGLVYHEGEYHLFYQYNPFGDKWGHMSWGHAVSQDLTHWNERPVALQEEGKVMMYSGSSVIDWANTSGFGKDGQPPIVAIYTGHNYEADQHKWWEDQRLAYSTDRGRTWTQFSGNPVIDPGLPDFRDPKVFWHEATNRWVMVIVIPNEKKVRMYASSNLRHWEQLSEFGPAGAWRDPIIWECPDLFPLRVEGEPDAVKWVLIVSINPGGPTGGSGTQYFVGEFDGTQFSIDPSHPVDGALWLDHGSDFYAAVSWSDVPESDGRRIVIGWMSNWNYTAEVPTSPWRGAMTMPRSLTLAHTSEGLRMKNNPIEELSRLRREPPMVFSRGSFPDACEWLSQRGNLSELLDVEMSFSEVTPDTPFSIRILTSSDEFTTIEIDPAKGRLTVDRGRSGVQEFHPAFSDSTRHEAPTGILDGRLSIRFLLDRSSLEVFAQEGLIALTDLIFPSGTERSISISPEGGNPLSVPKVDRIAIHVLQSVLAN